MRILCAAAVLMSACAAPPEWRSFGYDDANTRHNRAERAITVLNASKLVPKWRVDDLRGVTGTPVVADGAVYFGDWDGNLHAVAADDGRPLWCERLAKTSITSTVLAEGGVLYVSDGAGFLHARDQASGRPIWSVQLESHANVHLFSSPVLVDGRIVIGVSGFELMMKRKDFTFRGSVVAVDAATGRELWRVWTTQDDATSGAGVSVWSSAAVDRKRGLIYIGTGNTYEPPPSPLADGILAIRYATGEIAWSRSFSPEDVWNIGIKQKRGQDADVGGAPNLFTVDGRDAVGVGDKAGRYHALDGDTGRPIWSTKLTEASHLGGVMVAAAAGDGVIFVNSNVFANDSNLADPRNTSVTFALNARDGSVRWRRPLPAPAFGAVTLANGVVYHGTIDGTACALDAATGEVLWSHKPGADIAGGFAVSGGTLYVGHGYWFLFPDARKPKGGLVAYAVP